MERLQRTVVILQALHRKSFAHGLFHVCPARSEFPERFQLQQNVCSHIYFGENGHPFGIIVYEFSFSTIIKIYPVQVTNNAAFSVGMVSDGETDSATYGQLVSHAICPAEVEVIPEFQ